MGNACVCSVQSKIKNFMGVKKKQQSAATMHKIFSLKKQ